MQTHESRDVLKSGDIFVPHSESVAETPDQLPHYLVMGFRDACMQVAELGGRNRNDLVVLAKDIPAPGSFNRWRFRKPLEGLREDYSRKALDEIRASMDDLRTVESIEGAPIIWNEGNVEERGESRFTTFTGLDRRGLFHQVNYDFGNGREVTPVLKGVDLDRLGVIPQSYLGSTPGSYSSRLWQLTLDAKGAETIAELARANDLLMLPQSYIGYPVIPESHRDRAVSGIEAYLPSLKEAGRPRRFSSVKEAHQAVLEAIAKTVAA